MSLYDRKRLSQAVYYIRMIQGAIDNINKWAKPNLFDEGECFDKNRFDWVMQKAVEFADEVDGGNGKD